MQLNLIIKSGILALVFTTSLVSCTEQKTDMETGTSTTLPDGFIEFYTQFHNDTAFQFAHISFPIPERTESSGETGDTSVITQWTRDNWLIHRPLPEDGNFEQSFDILTPELLVETIRQPDQGFALQRRWALTAEGWKLVYYKVASVTIQNQ